MQRGVPYDAAHPEALRRYGVSPYSVYHPEVIERFPQHFNRNWREYWGVGGD
jgi:hypothetical protein